MKITALFVAFAAAADHTNINDRDSALDTDGIAHSHLNGAGIQNQNEVVHDLNIRPDGQKGSNFNQVTRAPSPMPSFDENTHDSLDEAIHDGLHNDDAFEDGKTEQIKEQDDRDAFPTKFPTQFPTKVTDDQDGSFCTSDVAWNGGITTRTVGWVGPGPGDQYCNIWKCEPGADALGNKDFTEKAEGSQTDFRGRPAFKKEKQTCSIHQYKGEVCSHTSCSFDTTEGSGTRKVVMVHSDHREEKGGEHMCGYSKHTEGCTCICSGERKQDADNFARPLASARVQAADHDETTDGTDWDKVHNSNNFYSKHSNNGPYVATTKDEAANTDTYSEKDQGYNVGDYVAHRHINGDSNGDSPY